MGERLLVALGSARVRLTLLGVLLAAAAVALALIGGPRQADVQQLIDGAGAAAPVVYVVLYAVLTLALFPMAVVTAAGGVVFGVAAGTALTLLGATLGATLAFLAGRRLGRGPVERVAGERTARLDRWLERRGLLAVLYVRLIPVLPFNALNYVCGATALRSRDYVIGTAVGIVPGTFAYAALGASIDDPTSTEFVVAVALVVVLAVGAPLVARVLERRDRGPAGEPGGAST